MKLINKFRNRKIQGWKLFLMYFMAVSIPLMVNIGNLSIIAAVVFSVWMLFKKKSSLKNFRSFAFYFPLLFFSLVLASALLSNDIHQGLVTVNKILLMPLIAFSLFTLWGTGIYIKHILLVFSGATVITTFILLVFSVVKITGGHALDSIFFHDFSALVDQHAVYFALYIALSFGIFGHYYLWPQPHKTKNEYLLATSLVILIIGLVLTASKAVLFIFSALCLYKVFSLRVNRKKKLTLLISFLLIGILAINVPIIQKRFLNGLQFAPSLFQPTEIVSEAKVFSYSEKMDISDLELRYLFLKIGTYHWWTDEKLLFGYGVGDVQDHLDYYYLLYNLAPNWFEGFNLHNQYLQILVSLGLFGFVFFISYLIYSFYWALKAKNNLYLYFLILITFVFFFECLLDRNKGIVFFVFFNTLFLIDIINNEDRYYRNPGNPKLPRWF